MKITTALAAVVLLAASAFAADTNRIKDLATTATSPASGDYLVIDGTTNGTRKILASNILANTVTAGTYGNSTQVPVITVNAKGVITSIANNTISGGGGGSGSGSVTDVSVTTANGVSGSVANSSSTPAITLSLGAITPTSVNGVTLTGGSTPALTVTGTTAVSGTNTGDQNLFGNIVVSGQTTVTANATAQNLTLAAGSNVTITTDNTTKTVTIAASGGGGGNTSATTTMTANNVTVGAGTTNVKTSPVTIDTVTGAVVTAGNITGNVGTFTTGNYVTLNATTLNAGNAVGSGNIILSPGGVTVTTAKVFTVTNNITLTGTDGTSFAFPSTNSTVVTKASRVVTFVLTIDDLADSLNYDIGYVGAAFTVTEIKAVHFGSGLSSPSVIATVKHGTDRTTGTTIEAVTVTSSTTGTSVTTGFDDATVPTDSFIWVETGSKSGTTDNLTIIVRGTYD